MSPFLCSVWSDEDGPLCCTMPESNQHKAVVVVVVTYVAVVESITTAAAVVVVVVLVFVVEESRCGTEMRMPMLQTDKSKGTCTITHSVRPAQKAREMQRDGVVDDSHTENTA